MEHQYTVNYDYVLKTYRKVYYLDTNQLFFLSEFSDEDRNIIKYSVDVEKENDSHYIIDSNNIFKLMEVLDCGKQTDELVTALTSFFKIRNEDEFVKFLKEREIKFTPYHFDDYSND